MEFTYSLAVRLPQQSPPLRNKESLTGRAFSLVELLVVIAIIIILATLSAPALTSVLRGSNLNRAGEMIADQINFARQTAFLKNRDVHVRMFMFDSGQITKVDGLHIWQV